MNYLTEDDNYYEMLGEMLESQDRIFIPHELKELAYVVKSTFIECENIRQFNSAVPHYYGKGPSSIELESKAACNAYKHSFAIMTNTVVDSSEFNKLLNRCLE